MALEGKPVLTKAHETGAGARQQHPQGVPPPPVQQMQYGGPGAMQVRTAPDLLTGTLSPTQAMQGPPGAPLGVAQMAPSSPPATSPQPLTPGAPIFAEAASPQ